MELFFANITIYVQQPITSFDGQIFSIGDKVQLGYANYNADEYTAIRLQPKEDSYFPQTKTGELPLTFVTIDKIITESNNKIFYDLELVIIVKSEVLAKNTLEEEDF